MSVSVTTAPAKLPISVDDVKCNMGIETHDDDAVILTRIKAAVDAAEQVLWSAFITQTLTLKKDYCFPPCFILPRAPLQSVTSVAYTDINGDSQTLATSQYTVDTDSRPGRIVPSYNVTWPTTQPVIQAVAIEYVAGYGDDKTDVPEEVREALIATVSARSCECGSQMREMLSMLLKGSNYDYSAARRMAEYV